jgi:uncharacterized protein YaiI (UPF0178 family)
MKKIFYAITLIALIFISTSKSFADTYNINNGDASITEDTQSITITIHQGNKIINMAGNIFKYKEIKIYKTGRIAIGTLPNGETIVLSGRFTDGYLVIEDAK